MTESRHTPGPWTVDVEDTNVFGEYRIQQCDPSDYRGDVDVANARLIAAAPDLLVAAQTAADLLIGLADDEERRGHRNAATNVRDVQRLLADAIARAVR